MGHVVAPKSGCGLADDEEEVLVFVGGGGEEHLDGLGWTVRQYRFAGMYVVHGLVVDAVV